MLDKAGFIQESCDNLFDSSVFRDKSIGHYFYFLASELPTILASDAAKITFSQMQTAQECLPGFYDFVFTKVQAKGDVHILWEIYDYTHVYQEYARVQQIKNEIDIHEQFLSRQKDLSSSENNFYSTNFFQSEYADKETHSNKELVWQLIHNKKADRSSSSEPMETGINDLNHLKNHLDKMINEIDQFLDEVKANEEIEVEIKTFMDDLARKNPSFSSERFTFIYNDSLPNKICINKNILSQILSLMCKDDFNHKVATNVALSFVPATDGNNENPVLLIDFMEQPLNEGNCIDDSTNRAIKLSILASLLTTLGGTLISKQSSNNPNFRVLINLPLKNC